MRLLFSLAGLLVLAGLASAATPTAGRIQDVDGLRSDRKRVVCPDANNCDAAALAFEIDEELYDGLEAAIAAREKQLRRPLRNYELKALVAQYLQPTYVNYIASLEKQGTHVSKSGRQEIWTMMVDDAVKNHTDLAKETAAKKQTRPGLRR